jgi:CheY-like chemotaxis protein
MDPAILVVSPNDLLREALAVGLTLRGDRVTEAPSVAAACQTLRSGACSPDLILLDTERNGDAVSESIIVLRQAAGSPVPAIALVPPAGRQASDLNKAPPPEGVVVLPQTSDYADVIGALVQLTAHQGPH